MIRLTIKKKTISYILSFFLFIFFFLGIYIVHTSPLSAQCRSGCYWNSGIGICTGSGGCVLRSPVCACISGEECHSGYCCDRGSCESCSPPGCPAGYTETNTGCSTTSTSCTRTYCTGTSCGTSYRTCYLLKYTLTYNAGTGGYISGTTPQSVCRGSNGTAVTAVANTGYAFQNWSDGSTTNPRTHTNVTSNITVTANFVLTNAAPTAPTSLLAEGQTNPVGVTDLTPEFSAIFNDPNSGDTAIYYQIQVNTSSAFNGTVMWDSGKTSMTALAVGARMPDKSYGNSNLTLNGQIYYWRIKFWDNSNAEGAWSSAASFRMNTAPTAPSSLLTEGVTNPTRVTDLTPEFSAICNDPDGHNCTYYEIHVNTNSSFTGTVMWNSGQVSMTSTANGARSPDISYSSSTQLALDGSTYYWRIRFTDQYGTVGAWSATANFRMNQAPTAPTLLLTEGATNPTCVSDITPEFSAICNDPDPDNCNMYEIHVNTNSSFTGTVMWNSGQVSMTSTANGARSPDISYASATPLSHNGITYYWRVRFTDVNGTVGAWSATANFKMNTAPTAPTSLLSEGVATPNNVTDLTPEFSAIFNDADTASCHTGASYQIQVNTASNFGGTSMWDSGKTSMSSVANGARMTDVSYAGNALTTNGNTYYWRIKFWDNVDGESPWSSTSSFIMQGAPTAPTALQTDGMTNPNYILTLTPSFSAIYNDPNNHNATAYEINVNTASNFGGTVMWNSGKTSTNVTQGTRSPAYVYNGTALVSDDTIYYWRIRFWDADDLQGAWSATATFQSRLNRQYFKGLQMQGIQIR